MSSFTDPILVQEPQDRVLIIHPGSNYIKIGWSTGENPKSYPHCLFTPNKYFSTPGHDYCAHRPTKENEEALKLAKFRGIRKSLLEERKILAPNSPDTAVTFKPVDIKDFIEFVGTVEKIKENDFLFGKVAIQQSFLQDGLLLYPFCNGAFNTTEKRNKNDIAYLVELIWSHFIDQFVPKSEISQLGVFLVVSEHIETKELDMLLKILFKIGFYKAFVHVENVMAAFGCGMSQLCVVDMGESKTSISVIEDGYSFRKSQILLNFGGFDMCQNLAILLEQSGFARLDVAVPWDLEALREIKDQGIHVMKGEEFNQLIKFYRKNQMYQIEIGDPLFLTPLGYLDNRLFRPCDQMEYHTIEDWVIESFKRSGMEITTTSKKKTVTKVDVLLVGGNSTLRGFAMYLEKSLQSYYEQRGPKEATVRVNVLAAKKDTAMFLSWKGADICCKLESSKNLWIKKSDYDREGIKAAKEKVPFKI